MDRLPLLVGTLIGCLFGAAVATVYFMRSARSASQVITETDERQTELASAQQEAASAKATLVSVREQLSDMRMQVEKERQRAERESTLRSTTQQELRGVQERIAEREKSIVELRTVIEQSKTALTDTFKATGADVLRQTAESLIQQAREQFQGQYTLSQQDLEARQRSIDATLAPIREQLVKNEQLVKELGEKREGDAKTLGEQLKQISELQQKASWAAQSLSIALRDNRQRGRWGEVSLRNIAEMAGLVKNVDFAEQASIAGDDGALVRPDMTVRLPGGRFVPIDSKVPMNAYFDSLDHALSDAERAQKRAEHAQALRGHVRGLSSREYAKALGEGVEITVLFMPFESGLIAALEEDGDIHRMALDARVVICTASTLLALLRTCALQWQQATLNENARRIGESAKDMLHRIGVFAEHLGKVGAGLDDATKAYNQAVGSFNARLLPGARDTAELAGDHTSVPDELELVNTVRREVKTRALPTSV